MVPNTQKTNPNFVLTILFSRIQQEKYYNQLIERKVDAELPQKFSNHWDNSQQVWNQYLNQSRTAGNEFLDNYESIEKVRQTALIWPSPSSYTRRI